MRNNKKKETRGKYGEGSIYIMKDGRYAGAVSLGKDANGKRLRPVVTGKTEEEVKRKMEALLKENRFIVETEVTIDNKTLVEDFIREFKLKGLLGKSKISSRTYENYEFGLKYFEEYFRGKPIGSINTSSINQFFSDMEKTRSDEDEYKYSQVTLDRIKYIVERMFKRGCNKGYISINPFNDEDFSKPKSKQDRHEVLALTEDEFEAIDNALKKHNLIYPVINLMLNTGMRTQEVLGLTWKNVDLDNGIIMVRRAITLESIYDDNGNRIERKTVLSTTKKGSGDRDIFVPEDVVKVLKHWRKVAPTISKTGVKDDDYVFGNSKNGHWTYSGFRTTLNRCIKRNIKDANGLRLHRIRHTVATLLAEDGASLFELMQLLGHSQTSTTMKYIDRASNKVAIKNRDRLGKCINRRLKLI